MSCGGCRTLVMHK
ncbi:hypothetical protein DA482_25565 [Pseudomonas fluorescens]|nr:hypothetical protein D0N73_27385 [Pseudomonas fluorescens]TWR45216.1 hypothetical protein FIP59_20680 [Pseudomonas fluorescens]